MMALAYYLLKVIIISGLLFGYYHLALKDKVFHQWNRFYLLASIVVAILLPLLNISVYTPPQHQSTIISAMEIVTGADEYVNDVHTNTRFAFTTEMLAGLTYIFVSLAIMLLFISALVKISRMIRRNQRVAIEDFYFLNTTEPGTPFSFFRYLLWNKDISLNTENGKRILEHELVHIRENHSWDKIFTQLVLVSFWANPFFWLIRNELTLIHEFIADRKAVGNGDAEAFAKLLLETSFPGYAPMLSNTFFKPSIKRRLSMITKQQHPGFNYLGRLMMIPILMVLLFTFGVKAKTMLNEAKAPAELEEKVTVVIDAGHGGFDAGAVSGGINEKDVDINIAKLVSELNRNPNIKIVLTRKADEFISVRDRVTMTDANKANLFLSVHTNAAPNEKESGISAYISGRDFSKSQQNTRFATLLLNNVSMVYTTDNVIKQRTKKGIWVLDENVCPSVMLHCGFITNASDRKFMTNKQNQENIAKQILQSIEDYFSKTVQIQPADAKDIMNTDTVPAKKLKNVTLIYEDGTKETVTPEEYRKKSRNENSSMNVNKSTTKQSTITIVTKSADSAGNVTTTKTENNSKYSGSNSLTMIAMGAANANSSSSKNPITAEEGYGIWVTTSNGKQPMYVLNGEEITEAKMKALDPAMIDMVNVLKGEDATKSYGKKAKNGVVLITLKK